MHYFSYQETGTAWLGAVPSEWKVSRLKAHLRRNDARNPGGKQVLSLYRELGIVPKDSRDDNHNVTSEDTSNYKYVRPGDFVINKMKAWQGSVAVSDYEGIVSPAYYVYKFLDDSIDRRYFHYLLRSCYKEEFMRLSGGIRIGQWDLSSQDLDNVPILIPSILEQTAIAAYLDRKISHIDSIIAEAKASIEEYKAWKASIIYEAVTKGLDKGVEMKDSGVEWIGETPIHWNSTKLKYFLDILPGYAFASEDFASEGIPLLRGINVAPNSIRWDDVVYWNKGINDSLRPFLLKEGDVVVGLDRPWISTGTRIAVVEEKDLPALLLQRVCRIRATQEMDVRFAKYWIESDSFEKSLSTETTGVSVPHISTGQIEEFKVSVPPIEEQKNICDYLETKCGAISSLIAEKESLIADLEAYKKSLIFEVVTGKRKVV